MTTHDTEQLMRALRDIRMSAPEREALRHMLAAYVQTYVPRPSALAFFMRHAVAFSVLALALVAGGTAVTAHDSLPGSPLYSMKTAVADRIELAVASDDEARLDAELRQIERALSDEERALTSEAVLRDDPVPSPSVLRFDDDAQHDIRDMEQELKDAELDVVPEA